MPVERRQSWGEESDGISLRVDAFATSRTSASCQSHAGAGAALALGLPQPMMERLDSASKIELGFPHDFLRQVDTMIYGTTRPLIDDHRA